MLPDSLFPGCASFFPVPGSSLSPGCASFSGIPGSVPGTALRSSRVPGKLSVSGMCLDVLRSSRESEMPVYILLGGRVLPGYVSFLLGSREIRSRDASRVSTPN